MGLSSPNEKRSGNNLTATVETADGRLLTRTLTNGFGQTIAEAQANTLGSLIETRREYNAKGQLVKSDRDTSSNTDPTAATRRFTDTGMTLTQTDARGNVKTHSYDTLGRPQTRRTVSNGRTVNDSFAYNSRSELSSVSVKGAAYSYAYDNDADGCKASWTNTKCSPAGRAAEAQPMERRRVNIRNRKSAQEAAAEVTSYTAHALNQYTAIQQGSGETAESFVPTYDADGNQTLVKTSTGIWSVQYNTENRPITFTNDESNTVVECTYDSMGHRATKQVTQNGSVTLHQRYIYRGYLQIAACDQMRSGHPCLWLIQWDPTQPIATRPLSIQKDGTWYCYGWNLTKNICEVFGPHGYIRTTYAYTPYGAV